MTISAVIHQVTPQRTRVLEDENLIEFIQIQKFDQLLAHQYCVRRFLLHYPAAFNSLNNIREKINSSLDSEFFTNENRLFIGRRITIIARSMRALHSYKIRSAAICGDKEKLRNLLEKELEPNEKDKFHPVLRYMTDEEVEILCDIFSEAAILFESIQSDSNFLNYYDAFALTNLVTGKTLFTHQISAKYGKYRVNAWAEYYNPEHYWLHTIAAELDEEMTGVVCENGYLQQQPESNVKIFGHNQHKIFINNTELKNHLILAVPTDQTPVQIDSALNNFRDCLKECFIDTRGMYANISTPEFDGSLFMRSFGSKEFLINETKQFRSRLCGLWIWDLVNPRKISDKISVEKAIDIVSSEVERLQQEFSPHEKNYDFTSYKNYYNLTVKQIAPKPKTGYSNLTGRDLDRYLTNGTTVIGRFSTCENP